MVIVVADMMVVRMADVLSYNEIVRVENVEYVVIVAVVDNGTSIV